MEHNIKIFTSCDEDEESLRREKDVAENGKGNGIKRSLRADTGILLVVGGCVQYPRQPGSASVKTALM